jgi:hypothetical protein
MQRNPSFTYCSGGRLGIEEVSSLPITKTMMNGLKYYDEEGT